MQTSDRYTARTPRPAPPSALHPLGVAGGCCPAARASSSAAAPSHQLIEPANQPTGAYTHRQSNAAQRCPAPPRPARRHCARLMMTRTFALANAMRAKTKIKIPEDRTQCTPRATAAPHPSPPRHSHTHALVPLTHYSHTTAVPDLQLCRGGAARAAQLRSGRLPAVTLRGQL